MKKYNIISVASEVAPFSKTGGLGDVARSLPKSLKRLGHSVTVITPLYKKLISADELKLEKVFENITVPIGKHTDTVVDYYKGELMPGLPIYFISCDRYFGHKKDLYGSPHENRRFFVFDSAALHLATLLSEKPDIIHCHDWQTGLIPELLKKQYKDHEKLKNASTVFTIHNLAFQFGHNWWEVRGSQRDRGIEPIPDLYDDAAMERVNFAKRAILHADVVNAVSETYAEEILEPRFGQDLHRILENRKKKLFGVVNGIDYNEYNPAKDPGLKKTYDYKTIAKKQINKPIFQKKHGLRKDIKSFVVIMASRIAEQKGFDILLPLIPSLMTLPNLQLMFMGDGDKEYVKHITKAMKEYPERIALIPFTENFETMLYAGGDVSLYPSRFEPCGTGQLKSLRYGCIPVARKIGGLSDTVEDFDHGEESGNGFVFEKYDSLALLVAITRAYAHFKHKPAWRKLVIRGMKQSNSWELPARKYEELYTMAIKFKQENGNGKM